jgi:hypothetical protein
VDSVISRPRLSIERQFICSPYVRGAGVRPPARGLRDKAIYLWKFLPHRYVCAERAPGVMRSMAGLPACRESRQRRFGWHDMGGRRMDGWPPMMLGNGTLFRIRYPVNPNVFRRTSGNLQYSGRLPSASLKVDGRSSRRNERISRQADRSHAVGRSEGAWHEAAVVSRTATAGGTRITTPRQARHTSEVDRDHAHGARQAGRNCVHDPLRSLTSWRQEWW